MPMHSLWPAKACKTPASVTLAAESSDEEARTLLDEGSGKPTMQERQQHDSSPLCWRGGDERGCGRYASVRGLAIAGVLLAVLAVCTLVTVAGSTFTKHSGSSAANATVAATMDAPVVLRTLPPHLNVAHEDDDTKYLGYVPHSGLNNQRSALENGWHIAHLLNRTLLVPPMWLGPPDSPPSYRKMQSRWNRFTNLHASEFNLTGHSTDARPDFDRLKSSAALHTRADVDEEDGQEPACHNSHSYECRRAEDEHVASWNWFAGHQGELEASKSRWNMSEAAIQDLVGGNASDVVSPAPSSTSAPPDILSQFVLEDQQHYAFHYVSNLSAANVTSPRLGKDDRYQLDVSLERLRELPHKVLLTGSLFGNSRVRAAKDARRTVIFGEPTTLQTADAIASTLGNYVGVHARVGDGGFFYSAIENMEDLWRRVVKVVGVGDERAELLWQSLRANSSMAIRAKRSRMTTPIGHALESDDEVFNKRYWPEFDEDEDDGDVAELLRRASFPLSAALPDESGLRCQRPPHHDAELVPLNVPVYLATDARDPRRHPALVPFFAAFPCLFTLSDYEKGSLKDKAGVATTELERVKGAVTETGVPFGKMLLPLLDAVVIAKGAITIGTTGSTFSSASPSKFVGRWSCS